MTDHQFLADFLEGRLAKADFDHLGHVRAAWLLLRQRPLPEAIQACCEGIQRLATGLGAGDKFHRTRSEALLRLMAPAAIATPRWDDFLAAQAELMRDARGLLARHYSPERLDDPQARRQFLAPDRLPLPT